MKRKYISKADLLVVLHYLGYIMQGLGIVLLVPILVALIYGEYIKVSAFLIPCFISFLIGTLFTKKLKKYEEEGLNGLKSKTGKNSNGKGFHLKKPKNKVEELELELMKKEIEIARLKKGYMVKGVGAEKEFVTTFDKNTK